MKPQITDEQNLATRRHCVAALRKLGLKELGDFEAHTLTWADLNAAGAELHRAARAVVDKLADEKTDEAERRSLEAASDALIEGIDAVSFEKDARRDLGSREPRAQGGDARRPGQGQTITARGTGGRAGDDAEPAFAIKPEARMVDWLRDRRGEPEFADLQLGAYLRALVVGAKTDAEKRALSEGTDSAGGFSVPDILSSRLIDLMRNRAVVFRAGAMTVPLTSDTNYIARVASDPVPAWRSEAGTVAESDPTFERVTLTPRSLAVLCKVSRELFEDSLNLSRALPEIIARAMAQEVDRVCLFGSGTAPEPRGVANTSGIGEVAHNSTIGSFAPLVSARGKLTAANFEGPTAFVMNPEIENVFAGLVDGDGQPLNPPRVIANVPMLHTGNVPTDASTSPEDGTIICGDFRQLMVGIRSNVRVEVLRERYSDNLQYGLLAHMRVDVAVEHAGAFAAITGVRV